MFYRLHSHLLFRQRNDALTQWGHPKFLDDLTQIFIDHLHAKVSTTPFSPTPLSPESLMILPHLEKLTKRGWWTVGSQPAVDGASSADEVVGWGPRAGYVFQKGFVEFFCRQEEVVAIERRVEERGGGWVHMFAGNDRVCVQTRIDYVVTPHSSASTRASAEVMSPKMGAMP